MRLFLFLAFSKKEEKNMLEAIFSPLPILQHQKTSDIFLLFSFVLWGESKHYPRPTMWGLMYNSVETETLLAYTDYIHR